MCVSGGGGGWPHQVLLLLFPGSHQERIVSVHATELMARLQHASEDKLDSVKHGDDSKREIPPGKFNRGSRRHGMVSCDHRYRDSGTVPLVFLTELCILTQNPSSKVCTVSWYLGIWLTSAHTNAFPNVWKASQLNPLIIKLGLLDENICTQIP